MQKLSTRQPNLESRMDLLKTIASENGITLQLDETPLSNEVCNLTLIIIIIIRMKIVILFLIIT